MAQRIADFRSDTVTRPTPAMREAMMRAEVGDDVFGDDPSVNALQAAAAERLGFEAALFAPSGTQCNLMALMSHCQRGDEAIVGQQWHTYKWEAGGMAVLGSIQPQPLENASDGSIPIEAIRAAIKADDAHFARTRLIAIENTTGGLPLPVPYLRQVRTLASEKGLSTHLDGARLFNAAVHDASGGDPWKAARDIASNFDSVSMCLSKGLGAPVGSLLLGSKDFIARAHRVRKMLGGGMRQAGILAAAGLHALDHHVHRLAEDHANCAALREGILDAVSGNAALRGRVSAPKAPTNILWVDVEADLIDALRTQLEAACVRATGGRYGLGARLRFVTHLDVGAEDVQRAVAAFRAFKA